MRLYGVLSVLLSLVLPALAIFADEAFHIDYHHALLGSPQSHSTFFHKPSPSTNATLLYTISDKGVLGAVNPKDGSLLWRQFLAGRPADTASSSFLVAAGSQGQLISAYDRTVSCWDALDGKLVWDFTVAEGTQVQDLQAIPGTGSIADVVVLAAAIHPHVHSTLDRIAGDGTGSKWQHVDSTTGHGSSASIVTTSKHVFYITKSHGLLAGGKAKIVTLDSVTGRETGSSSLAVDSEPLGANGQYSTGSGSNFPFLISADKPFKSVKFSLLESLKVSTLALGDKGEEIESIQVHHPAESAAPAHFLLHILGKTRQWAEVYHVNAKSGEAVKAYSLPATEERSTFAASNIDGTAYFTRSTETEVILYSSESHGQLGRWQKSSFKTSPGSSVSHASAEVVSRGKESFAVRVAEYSPSGDWSLVRNGQLQWSRPEMLAYTTIAAWEENGAPDALAEELDLEASVNPLTAYIHRLKRHLTDLGGLPAYLQNLPTAILESSPDADATARKNLVGTKIVVLGTSRHEVIALDSTGAGAMKWQTDLSSHISPGVEMKSLTVRDSKVSLYLSDGSLVILAASDGKLLEHKLSTIPAAKLVHLEGTLTSAMIKIGSDGTPRPADEFGPVNTLEGNVVVTITDDGKAVGWTIGQSVEKMWTLEAPDGMSIVSAVARAEHDPVASIGKVLGDRSVLYKYLSPNVALLLATSGSTLTVYLIDAVTGSVLHTSTHQGILSATPVPAVVSENWFAYSFVSQDPATLGLSNQLIVSELYEASTANDRGALGSKTNYSSFSVDAGARPHVTSQSFTLAEPISHLAVSQTAQGITSRQLLATLPQSNAIVGIPREAFDARRPVDREPTNSEREEGLVRYVANLELDPKWFLTHAREVVGIKSVLSSPSLLESTSVIFAFGHDIFGTQITPSLAFDVLGKGFNKVQLALTVVALAAGVFAIRPLVRKKTVEGRWKQ